MSIPQLRCVFNKATTVVHTNKTPGLNMVQASYYIRERLFFLFWFGDKRVEQEQDLIKLFILSLKATIDTLLKCLKTTANPLLKCLKATIDTLLKYLKTTANPLLKCLKATIDTLLKYLKTTVNPLLKCSNPII